VVFRNSFPGAWRHFESPAGADWRYCSCDGEAGTRGAGPIWRLWVPGRKIPSFCILWISVVRFNPSLAAAPFGPPITQPTASSVCRIRARSESRSVVAPGDLAARCSVSAMGRGFGSTPSLERITARSIRFCSSRICTQRDRVLLRLVCRCRKRRRRNGVSLRPHGVSAHDSAVRASFCR